MLLKTSVTSELAFLNLDPADTHTWHLLVKSVFPLKREIWYACLFQKDMVSVPNVVSYWNNSFPNLNWKKIWCLLSKFLIINKVKDVSLKLISTTIQKGHWCKLLILQTIWRRYISFILVLPLLVCFLARYLYIHFLKYYQQLFSYLFKCILWILFSYYEQDGSILHCQLNFITCKIPYT